MNYKEKVQAIDIKLRSLQKIAPLNVYVKDGIVNIEQWQKQSIRPLFIGKEAHGDGFNQKEWSITSWIDKDPNEVCRSARHSWQKTAYVSHALQHNFIDYDDIPYIRDDKRIAESLRSIAFVNVGKYGAETTTPWRRLDSLYKQNRVALHDQIEFYQPNVIVGWSTLPFFEKDADFSMRFGKNVEAKQQGGSVDCWLSNGRLFIDAYHPASYKITQQKYVDDIVRAVKVNVGSLDQTLPTF